MSLVFQMAFINIKKRKLSSITTTVILTLTMLLLIAAFSILYNTSDLYDRVTDELNTSDAYIYSNSTYQSMELAQYHWEQVEGASAIVFPYHHYSGIVYIGEKKITSNIAISIYEEYVNQDKYAVIEGVNEPQKGEIWLTTGFAYANEINIGDEIKFAIDGNRVGFKVTGIVVDPPFSTMMDSNVELFVSNSDYDLFETDDTIRYIMKVKLDKESDFDNMIYDWEDKVGENFSGKILRKEEIKSLSSFQINLSAMIMFVTSVILMGVIIVVVIFSVVSDITSEYKNIGILMSCGFSTRKIRFIYISQYILIFLFATPIAITSGVAVVKWILNEFLLKSLGFNGVTIKWELTSTIVVAFTLFLILISTFLATRKASRLTPINTIMGREDTYKKSKVKKVNTLSKGPMSIILIRDLKQKLGQIIFILFMGLAVTFITLLILNITRPMKETSIFREYSGIKDEDLVILIDNAAYEEVIELLQNDSRVIEFFDYSEFDVTVNAQNNIIRTSALGKVYGKFSDDINSPVKDGRNPKNSNEIAISTIIKDLYNKEIGDTIDITLGEDSYTMDIVGISQSTSNAGKGIRVSDEFFKAIIPEYRTNMFCITLVDDTLEDEFTEEYLDKEECLTVVSINSEINKATTAVLSGVNFSIIIVNLILWAILLIVLFNVILLNIIRQKKIFGTLSVVGFSPIQKRTILITPVFFASMIGILIGALLINTIGIDIMNMVYYSIGVSECPYSLTIKDYLLLSAIYLTFVVLASNIPASKVDSISPRDLLLED